MVSASPFEGTPELDEELDELLEEEELEELDELDELEELELEAPSLSPSSPNKSLKSLPQPVIATDSAKDKSPRPVRPPTARNHDSVMLNTLISYFFLLHSRHQTGALNIALSSV